MRTGRPLIDTFEAAYSGHTTDMATSTQTTMIENGRTEGFENHALRQIRKPGASNIHPATDAEGGDSSSGTPPGSTLAAHGEEQDTTVGKPPQPWLRIFSVGFSFFCAGINDSTLGPLIPHLLKSFSIGTGMVAVL